MDHIFTFSSRNGAMRFYDAAVYDGISAKLVNTPQQAGVGCGLSVKCWDEVRCRELLSRGRYDSLVAIFYFDGERYIRL